MQTVDKTIETRSFTVSADEMIESLKETAGLEVPDGFILAQAGSSEEGELIFTFSKVTDPTAEKLKNLKEPEVGPTKKKAGKK